MRKTSKNGCLDAHFSTARGSRASCSRSESTYSPALAPLGFGRSNNPRRVASAMSKKVALLAYGRCWRKSFQQLWQTTRRADAIRRRLESSGSPLCRGLPFGLSQHLSNVPPSFFLALFLTCTFSRNTHLSFGDVCDFRLSRSTVIGNTSAIIRPTSEGADPTPPRWRVRLRALAPGPCARSGCMASSLDPSARVANPHHALTILACQVASGGGG